MDLHGGELAESSVEDDWSAVDRLVWTLILSETSHCQVCRWLDLSDAIRSDE